MPGGSFTEMNLQCQIIDSFKCGNGLIADTHDFELLSNGTAMLEALNPVLVDNAMAYDNVIQILDKSKDVVFQWNALDHFQVSDATHEDTMASSIDFAHINSLQTDIDGNIIASFRNLDEITKIDRETGEIIWHWGGKHNQFRFISDTLKFSHQHDARRIDNGNITLWDNGNFHTLYNTTGGAYIEPSSRAVEYVLDETEYTATAVWEYRDVPFSNAAGNVQRLTNGNTFIGLGNISAPSAIEVMPSGDRVYQVSLPEQTVSYRVYRFDLPALGIIHVPENITDPGIRSIVPNPVRALSTIDFYCNETGTVKIKITNAVGIIVRTWSESISMPGEYSHTIDFQDLASGPYVCTFSQNGKSSGKIILVQK